MKKIRLNLIKLMLLAGVTAFQTQAYAQCQIKVQLNVTPTNCKNDCTGSATVVDIDNAGSLSFFWSNGATTQTVTGLCEGPISVTVWQGGPNCAFDLTKEITVAYEVKVNCLATVPTAPGTITTEVSGGVEPYTYDWFTNPHQFTSSITNLPAGSYFVIVTDANGCSDYTSCDIVAAPPCFGKTITMGGWGAPPNGNNPASYMYANFASAFPSGAQIGCTNKLRLTTPQAVTNFLPSGSTASALPAGTLTNPGGSYKNVLAGQAMALTLSLGFDNNDPNFSSSNVPLGSQVVGSGPFIGMTVNQLLAEANKKLGGCASPYTFAQLNTALTKVNENYDGGNVNKGFLNCSGGSKLALEVVQGSLNYSVHPNPASGSTTVTMVSETDDHVSVEIYNMTGRKVAQVYNNEPVHALEEVKLTINTSDLADGIYILNFSTSVKTYQQKLVVKK